jgi:pectinesterase
MDCTIMGHGLVWLGRAWGSSSRVVFVRTYMDDIIIPAGWTDFGDSTVHK